jgi:uncharacterized NAD(P)/FAD-binding protein YdhS
MTPSADEPARLAIIGGGFTGAAFAIHVLKAASRPVSIDIIEPASELGRGAAYGTDDPVHRINVPSDRMSLFSGDGNHFTRWLFEHGWLPDYGSTDPRGHHYVPRSAFGAYVSDNLKRAGSEVRNGVRLRVRNSRTLALQRESLQWRVILCDRRSLLVDRVALCIGHRPGIPCPISDAAMCHPGLVSQPWKPRALAAIGKRDSILIVGTGLTMADVIVSLERVGHKGVITAVSRRGLLPRTHRLFRDGVNLFDGNASPESAIELLRAVRRSIQAHTGNADWQSVVDAVRVDLPIIWRSLPSKERVRAVRRLLPYWEVHRFRISPQTHEAVVRTLDEKRLTIERAALSSLDAENGGLAAALSNSPGGRRVFDSVVLCAGPSKEFGAQPLLADLINDGLVQIDEVGLGLKVDPLSRVLDSSSLPQASLLAFGPITRGSFGEMTGVPDIIRQIERVAPTVGNGLP